MEAYCAEVRKLEARFDGFELCHIPWRDNKEADSVARVGLTQDMPPARVFLDELTKPSAWWEVETQPLPEPSEPSVIQATGSNPDWAWELLDYLSSHPITNWLIWSS
jgi:hypothetical protein